MTVDAALYESLGAFAAVCAVVAVVVGLVMQLAGCWSS
jgi:hypothetical protein